MKPSRICICLSLLLLAACHQQEATIEFETVVVDKTTILSNDEMPPTCSINLRLQQATEQSGQAGKAINATVTERLLDRDEQQMENAAQAFADDYAERYKKALLPLYNMDRGDLTKRAWYHYHYIINATTQPGRKGTVAYLANINYQEGTKRLTDQLVVMNFETRTGQLLGLQDVFVDGYEAPLNKLLLSALMTKTRLSSKQALHSMGYLRTTDIYPPENFILGDEAITFVYNPDEIAPGSVGTIELVITYAQLEKILKTTFID